MQSAVHRYFPHFVAVFLFFYCWNLYWGGTRYKGFFLGDSSGYYAYLPATFIYGDPEFSFVDPIREKYFSSFHNFDFRNRDGTGAVDKWFCGTAAAIAPFFLLAHGIALLSGSDADGYSFWYAWGLNMASVFYCFAGLLALRKILQMYFSNAAVISGALLLSVFATNLFYYATSEPAMSHVYSFAFINLFVLCSLRLLETGNARILPVMGVLLGLITLIRPVNAFVIFVLPFLAGDRNSFIRLLKTITDNLKHLIPSFLLFSAVITIQLIFYKLQTGEWFLYSYGIERMNLDQPHLADFLFSYKKGLFVYLPVVLISLAGFVFLYRKGKWQFYSLLIFFSALCYIFSSWWNWWYGGSFGIRPMIDFLFIPALLLGIAFDNMRPLPKKVFLSACLFCLLLCQVQTYQYRYYHIHWDKMDKEHYWRAFMRVDLLLKKENPNGDLLK